MNSLRGLTAPRASLAHHLTAIPDEGLRTNELIKQMSEQASVGVDRRRRLTRGGRRGGGEGWLWLGLNLRTAAISACRPELGVSPLVSPESSPCSCPVRYVLLGRNSFSLDSY